MFYDTQMYCSDHDYVSHHSAASEDCDQLGVWPQPQPLSYPECPAYSSGYNDVLESQNIADIAMCQLAQLAPQSEVKLLAVPACTQHCLSAGGHPEQRPVPDHPGGGQHHQSILRLPPLQS